MMDQYRCIENTPSVYFHFDQSNMKSGNSREYIPYQYSNTTHRAHFYQSPTRNKTINVTPLISRIDNQQQTKQISGKIDTEQFFNEFQENFVVKFGDSPLKCQFSKHLDFNIHQNDQNIDKENICKLQSNISEPITLVGIQNIQNEQSAQKIKERNPKIACQRIHCEIRKRVLFKNHESLAQKGNCRKTVKRIINDKNLLIITSSNWSCVQEQKKQKKGPFSHPIKASQKQIVCANNIFSTHPSFRETLRSTTLDNWKKKHSSTRHRNYFAKNNKKLHNLFQKPFSIIR